MGTAGRAGQHPGIGDSGLQRGAERAVLLTELGLPDVHQHVCVGAMPHGQVVIVAPVVVLDGLLLRTPGHHVVVKFTPLTRKARRRGRDEAHKEAVFS